MTSLFLLASLLFVQHLGVNSLSGTCNSYTREKVNEGYKPKVYIDTEGHPTVGIGFNLDRNDAEERLSEVGADYDMVRAGSSRLTDDQIQRLFSGDMASAVNCASMWLSSVWWKMSTDQQSAVADMAFNLGCSGLMKFRNMKAALERQDYGQAAAEMRDSKWCRQVKGRCDRDIACMSGRLSLLMRLLQLKFQ